MVKTTIDTVANDMRTQTRGCLRQRRTVALPENARNQKIISRVLLSGALAAVVQRFVFLDSQRSSEIGILDCSLREVANSFKVRFSGFLFNRDTAKRNRYGDA
jgi:hypothetical protein